MKQLFLIWAVLLCWQAGYASPSWPNEPANSEILTDNPLNTKIGDGWSASYPEGGKIVSDPGAPLSPPNVLQYSRNNMTQGDASQSYYGFPDMNELYFGFWWKPSNPFYGWPNNAFQKVALVKNRPSQHFYVGMHRNNGGGFSFAVFLNYSLVENSHLGNGYGVGSWMLFANRGNANVALGAWHRMEFYVKKSTTTTSRDGVLRWWMDGVLQGDYSQVNYPGPFWSAWLAPIWDAGVSLPGPEYHFYDHAHISVPQSVIKTLSITTTQLPAANSGTSYVTSLKAEGGLPPYKWAVTSETVPAGLTFYPATGFLSGTPTQPGITNLTFSVTDTRQIPITVSKSLSLVIGGTSAIEQNRAGSTASKGMRVVSLSNRVVFEYGTPERAGTIAIYNLTGQKVWSSPLTSAKAQWNFGAANPKGAYVVRMQQGAHVVSAKFCVIK